jgi:hypothetical protein
MSARLLSDIRQTVRQNLRDEFDVDGTQDFDEDELDVIIDLKAREVSGVSPFKAVEPVIVTANSKLLDVSGLEDLLSVRMIEYTPDASPRNFRNFTWWDNQTLEMDVSSAPSATGTDSTLTGTVTFTSGSATVTGSGTDFDGELAAGDYIRPSTKSRWYRVYSITDDEELVLDQPVKSGDAGADTEDATQYRSGVALVHYDKLHVLTETESTLNPKEEDVVILGATADAAIALSRKKINAINDGGSQVSDKMKTWGLDQLALYQQKLRGLSKPQIKKSYAQG